MNRRVGTLLLSALVVSILFNPSASVSPASPTNPASLSEQESIASQKNLPGVHIPAQDLGKDELLSKKCLPDCPGQDLFDTVRDFFGAQGEIDDDSLQHWGVPLERQDAIRYMIAIVPDPVHTHLSLFFDRTTEAIQQGAQEAGYIFARAIMPWDSRQHLESSDWRLRVSQKQYERSKARAPGLMIFRRPPRSKLQSDLKSQRDLLFVFVVGETPTSGILKDQFHSALLIINRMSWVHHHLGGDGAIAILGPTFSGSLYSLAEMLEGKDCNDPGSAKFIVHSGSISDKYTVEWFKQNINKCVHFATFQESDFYALAQFVRFVTKQGYDPERIAVLSEDETAYGSGGPADSRPKGDNGLSTSCERCPSKEPTWREEALEVIHLYFPRDISQLRSAYQQDLLKAEAGTDKRFTPRTTLPLNLEDVSSDEDSVQSYAHQQTPLSQEAVLLGIVTNLKAHNSQFVVVRATNPLDSLFLSRFLRTVYPEVRVVTMGADLLFQREKDNTIFHGTLALTPYSLRPRPDDSVARPSGISNEGHVDRVFPSSNSAGIFNATLSLLSSDADSGQGAAIGKDTASKSLSFPNRDDDAPPARYTEYGWPRIGRECDQSARVLAPKLWLTVLGRDGYWPLALLSSDSFQRNDPDVKSTIPAISQSPWFPRSFESAPDSSWKHLFCFFIALAVLFNVLCWKGSLDFPSEAVAGFANAGSPHRPRVLVVAALLLLIGQCSLLWPEKWTNQSLLVYCILWCAIVGSSMSFTMNFIYRQTCSETMRRKKIWAAFGAVFIVVVSLFWIFFHSGWLSDVFFYRLFHVSSSGASPLLPLYMLLASGLWWAWYSLSGLTLLDERRPLLPKSTDLNFLRPGATKTKEARLRPHDLSEQGITKLVEVLKSAFSGLGLTYKDFRYLLRLILSRRMLPVKKKRIHAIFALMRRHLSVFAPAVLPPAVVILAVIFLVGARHPVQSLEGKIFDRIYAVLLALAIFTLLCDLIRLAVAWVMCRRFLQALERLPLRRGFNLLKGFSWRPIWRLGGDYYRVSYRELESWTRIKIPAELSSEVEEAVKELNAFSNARVSLSNQPAYANKIKTFHRRIAGVATAVLRWLDEKWAKETEEERARDLCKYRDSVDQDRTESDASSLDVRSAERFVCFVYLNFILSVMLRMRMLAFTIGGMYVLILLSVNSYPFEPQFTIHSFMVLLLIVILAFIAFVYAQMHRDATLSRITDTKPGELGIDFWFRLGSFAALPLLSLLAAQFPEIGSFLFSWLQPALNAMKW